MPRDPAALLSVLALSAAPMATQLIPPPSPKPDLPPLSYVCPMPADADVIEDKPGTCPKCGMRLNPIRLDTTWTCPVHAAVHKDKRGTCPIDGRDLIPMTMSVDWTCKDTEARSLQPGACPDGSPMAQEYLPRPHGNHNPQHGGQFFMAPDNWHHLEGAYPRANVFRLYLYDDYTKPLPRAQVRAVTAQVVRQGQTFPLVSAQHGRYLVAKMGPAALPVTLEAKVAFKAGAPPYVFDFSFGTYSKDQAVSAPTITKVAPVAPPAAILATPAVEASAMTVVAEPTSSPTPLPSGVDTTLIALPIPDTVPELLAQLHTRTVQIRGLIDEGLFGEIYVPAFQAKDLAVALEAHESELPPDRRPASEAAIAALVREAYLLDAFGDLGNRQQISAAFNEFAAASTEIVSIFQRQQP
jgi:hypothetical protein